MRNKDTSTKQHSSEYLKAYTLLIRLPKTHFALQLELSINLAYEPGNRAEG